MNSDTRVSAVGSLVEAPAFTISCGCDVDSHVVAVAVFNVPTGEIETREYEQTQAGATAAAEWLLSRDVEIAILESTANYHQLFYAALRQQKLNAHVINPTIIKALLAVEGKSDKADAINMARLAAHFKLRTSNMPDDVQLQIRLNLRRWDADKAARTRASNGLRALMTHYRVPIFRRVKPISPSGRGFIQIIAFGADVSAEDAVNFAWKGPRKSKPELVELLANLPELPPYVREEVAIAAAEIDRLTDRIAERQRLAERHIQQFQLGPQIEWMTTAPAVSRLLALRIIAEAGVDFHARYHSAEAFCKACGLAPANMVSGGKLLKSKKGQGNKYIKQHFIFAVKGWMTTKRDHPLKRWRYQYRQRAGYKRAAKATAHKIAKSLWHMGRKGGEAYNPHGLGVSAGSMKAPGR